jgi:hypothetical protein
VKKQKNRGLNFEIDKLTRSIENAVTGDSLKTEITLLEKKDLKSVSKKNGWLFNWKKEFLLLDRNVFKLTIEGNPTIIQGLMSITIHSNYVEMHLIENAYFNRGNKKMYLGVAGNLVAFACKISFESGGSGFVSFLAKTRLIEHYKQSLGAQNMHGHLMVINEENSKKLVEQYYKL